MLTSDQFDRLVRPVTDLYEEYATTVINDIARRLVKLDMTSTAAYQAQRLIESGKLYEDILKEISKLTGISEETLAKTFSKAGVTAMRFDDSIYRAAGLDPLPLNLSPQMVDILKISISRTNRFMQNLTRTTALTGQGSFIQSADLAFLKVSTGAFSYDDAIRTAVKDVSATGLKTINFASGATDQIDVAMRRTVLTGVGQMTGELQVARAEEMGQDLVQVSEHIGARPSHALWQGGIYSRSGTSDKYPDFVSSTEYGSMLGLGGINCRHSFYPFFAGISKDAYENVQRVNAEDKSVTYNREKITAYEATQKQRYLERGIRKWKREADALGAAGLDNSKALAKVREWQARQRDFINQTGLDRQYAREGGRVAKSFGQVESVNNDGAEKEYRRFENEEVREKIVPKYNDEYDSLTLEEKNALSRYRTNGYSRINGTLREDITPEEMNEMLRKRILALDSAISKSELEDDMLLFRGTPGDFFEHEVGDVFTDKGFVSTTTKDDLALFFSSGKVGYQIQVDKGQNAFFMKQVELERRLINEGEDGEFEFLLPRGTSFEVLDIELNGTMGRYDFKKVYTIRIVK